MARSDGSSLPGGVDGRGSRESARPGPRAGSWLPPGAWWILAGAVLLRLLLVALWSPPLAGDALEYDRLASSLAAGEGYVDTEGQPTSWRPPLYPAFVAAIYALGGSAAWVPWIQAVLDLVTVALVLAITSRALGSGAALAAGGLVAVNVGQISAAARLLSETLFTLLLLAAVAATFALEEALESVEAGAPKRGRRALLAASAGALLAVGSLTRGVLILFPAALAGALLLAGLHRGGTAWGSVRVRATAAAVMLCSFAAVLAPWALRNLEVHGRLVPVATQSGITLYASYFPPEDRLFGILPTDATTEAARTLPEAEADAFLTRRALEGIAADPGRLPRLTLLKALYFGNYIPSYPCSRSSPRVTSTRWRK